jgi:hypothetical protein
MRKKLIALLFALAATAGALGLFTPKPAAAIHCNGFLVCCPDGGCHCCIKPCSIQCP